ncbi:MAG TPA: PspC domain-containing protein [Candidatus Hydrogenedentes bacterium]|nr:PspC domain-containing protein [Candidatus Hydrogenedentota bacterium]
MALNATQQQRIERYFREVDAHLATAPLEVRRRALEQLRGRVESELRRLDRQSLMDEDIDAVVRSCGAPAHQARSLLDLFGPKSRQAPAGLALDATDPRWLGVCGGVARCLGMEPLPVRLVAVLLGLALGPIAMLAYVGGYFALYFGAPRAKNVPEISWRRFARTLTIIAALAFVLHAGAMLFLDFALRLYVHYAGVSLTDLAPWTWLEKDRAELFWGTLAFAAPFAMLGGLPAANSWPGTAYKVAQAIVALYAVILCFGIASALAGMILQTGKTIAAGGLSIG